MIEQGAPESDIAQYIQEEGVTAAQLRAAPDSPHVSATASHSPNTGTSGWNPTVKVVKDGRKAALGVYPGLRITQVERDPDSPLGRKNPKSWHNHTAGAIDVDANSLPKGMTFEQYLDGYRKAGYPIVASKNEDETRGGKRAPHATGNHWHVVLGPREGGADETADVPNPEPSPDSQEVDPTRLAIAGMVDAGKSIDEIKAAYPDWFTTPEQTATVDGWIKYRASGGQSPITYAQQFNTAAPAPEEPNSFFRMPKDMAELGKGLEYGTGSIVEGVGDTLGIVANPLSTVIGRALGYENYTADLGATMRDGLGLDRPAEGDTTNRIAGDIVSGASGGGAFSGLAKGGGKAAGSLVQQGLAKMGNTPVRDVVAGGTAALAADGAEAMGAGPVGQTAAAIVGGGVGGLGIAPRGSQALAATTERLVPRIAQQRFEARQAMSKYRTIDRTISGDMRKLVDGLKPAGKLSKAEKVTLLDRVSELESSYLPYDDLKALALAPSAKAKLTSALDRRHLIGDDEIDALADGTEAGDATALAIRKARRLRAQVPEVAGRSNVGAGRFLAEALAGTAGFKVGGFTGYALGSAAARKLTRGGNSAADKAIALASDHSKFGKMPEEMFGTPGTTDASEVLKRLASETRDAPWIAKQEATAEAERLAAEGRKVGIANARDDVRPSGGWRGLIYERTGLLPSQQDAGALKALKEGNISPEQFRHFLDAPDNLMPGNAGNALTDRLASMADSGHLKRDPSWTAPRPEAAAPPLGAAVDAQGNPIRSMPAYQAGAAKNVARELPLLQELDAINVERAAKYDSDPEFRKIAGTAVDPYASRIKALQETIKRNRSGGAGKP